MINIIHSYWFGEASDTLSIRDEKNALWWGKSPEVDEHIKDTFGHLPDQVKAGEHDAWLATPLGRLAQIIVCDQFTRNMFRGDAQTFSYDDTALGVALEGIKLGIDQQLRPIERVFMYMPLEHSENMLHQTQCIALFQTLRQQVPESEHAIFTQYLEFARRHAVIIERFGRFPHRNAVLGRTSSAAEIEFLQQPGSSF